MSIGGNAQPRERNACVEIPRRLAGGAGRTESPYSLKPKAWASMGTSTSLSEVSAALMGGSGSRL